MKAEENRSAVGLMRGSRPDNRMKPRRGDNEFMALEFDSTLGYPGLKGRRESPISVRWKDAILATSLHGEYHVEELPESARDAKM